MTNPDTGMEREREQCKAAAATTENFPVIVICSSGGQVTGQNETTVRRA